MRPREIPLLVATAGVFLSFAAGVSLPAPLCGYPAPTRSSLGPLFALVGLLVLVARARSHRGFLLDHVSEEVVVAGGETYRSVVRRRQLSAVVARDWRRRVLVAFGAALLCSSLLVAARPPLGWLAVASAGTLFGAALYLPYRQGRAALLYLPVMACALLHGRHPFETLAAWPLFVLAFALASAFVDRWVTPLGGYDLDGVAIAKHVRVAGTFGWTIGWLAILGGSITCLTPFPAYPYQGYIKQTEGNAREIRNAVNRWRGAKGGTECPTITQLVQDHEIDSASKLDDACGSPYRIVCTEDDVEVTSPGPDRVLDTKDDVVVPRRTSHAP